MSRGSWAAVAAIVAAIVFHALMPRYQVSIANGIATRVDRWTGTVEATRDLTKVTWATVTK